MLGVFACFKKCPKRIVFETLVHVVAGEVAK